MLDVERLIEDATAEAGMKKKSTALRVSQSPAVAEAGLKRALRDP